MRKIPVYNNRKCKWVHRYELTSSEMIHIELLIICIWALVILTIIGDYDM